MKIKLNSCKKAQRGFVFLLILLAIVGIVLGVIIYGIYKILKLPPRKPADEVGFHYSGPQPGAVAATTPVYNDSETNLSVYAGDDESDPSPSFIIYYWVNSADASGWVATTLPQDLPDVTTPVIDTQVATDDEFDLNVTVGGNTYFIASDGDATSTNVPALTTNALPTVIIQRTTDMRTYVSIYTNVACLLDVPQMYTDTNPPAVQACYRELIITNLPPQTPTSQ